jgi:thioredoxin reductase (NADPH)
MQRNHHKVLIIGGGPAGLTAAIYTGRAQLKPFVAMGSVGGDLGSLPGGQLMNTTEVENFPGFPNGGISGPDLMEKIKQQAVEFGAQLVEKWVTWLSLDGQGGFQFKLSGGDDAIHFADSIIIATGATAKWLNLENEEHYRNNGLSTCATCDGPLRHFRNKHLFVVGGGDTAMEEALFLTKFASQVTIIHRRDTFRASQLMQQRVLAHPKIDVLWNSQVVGYQGDDFLERLVIKNTTTTETTVIDVGGLFVAIGHTPATSIFAKGLMDLDDNGYVKVNNQVMTNISGIFAAGDVHDTHYRQAITAAGLGCMAAIQCERWLAGQAPRE